MISTRGLTKRYGSVVALDGLDLDVPSGVVFGYLGPNGAGKTTTIRLLMGLLRPTDGHAEVFGLDAGRDRDAIHARVGYLPGDFVAYGHLTAERYLRYLADLRGSVAWTDVDLLAKRFDLDLGVRIDAMSHGTKQKVGLVQAFMHHPELLVLDEPTSGLDPLMQREFEALVREVRAQGRTVFLSSHVLHEVEELADLVAIVSRGRLIVVQSVDILKARAVRRLDITFTGPPPLAALRAVPHVSEVSVAGETVHLAIEGSMEQVMQVAAPFGIRRIVSGEVDLEEIFLRYVAEGGRP